MKSDWKTAIPWLLSIVTIAVGIWQYADKQTQANRKPFLQKQLELVFEASETVATLASTTDTDDWRRARARFWVLYWGPLPIVEDQPVVNCMVATGRIVGQPGDAVPDLPVRHLHPISIAMAEASRDLILSSWEVELPQIEIPASDPKLQKPDC